MYLARKFFSKVSNISSARKNKNLKKQLEKSNKIEQSLSYNEEPLITFIVQFFNKKQNINKLIPRLRVNLNEELIIIDDGSSDGSYGEWPALLNRPNDFLIRANDLFEIRTYDRAISMARGKYICLLQDDDLPPVDNIWIKQAIQLFENHNNLLILGGRDATTLLTPDPVSSESESCYYRKGDIAGTPGVAKYKIYKKPLFKDPKTGIPFMFSMSVNRAPTFIRRQQFLDLGGIDQSYAPFQCDDTDACIRAWQNGFQVGFYSCPFIRDVGIGGMRAFNSNKVPAQARKNWLRIYDAYGSDIADESLENSVKSANEILTQNGI